MAATSQLRALVADDDSNCRESLTLLLSLEGFQTCSIDGGSPALEIVRRQILEQRGERENTPAPQRDWTPRQRDPFEPKIVGPIHFLVLDNNMPDLSGLEVLRELRDSVGEMLPAILVSGRVDRELEESVRRVGGFALLPKPIQPIQFRREIWRLVRHHMLA